MIGMSYHLKMRETRMDNASMYFGRPGSTVAREAFGTVEARAALENVRRLAATSAPPPNRDGVRTAKLRALLRDPDAFVPCRGRTART